MFRTSTLFLFLLTGIVNAQTISGIVLDEDQNRRPGVLVFNMKTALKAYTDRNGEFNIEAGSGDELRVVRNGFERGVKIVRESDFVNPLVVTIIREATEIEEVKLPSTQLTGKLNIDSRNLTRLDKFADLNRKVGVPGPPEKPREKPAEVVQNILLPLIGYPPTVNVQAIYDVVSGKAKRQKRLYKYEDLGDHIAWIRSKISGTYFTEMNIPPERISEFLQFSIGVKPEITKYIKARNISKVLFILEDTFPIYLDRISNTVTP